MKTTTTHKKTITLGGITLKLITDGSSNYDVEYTASFDSKADVADWYESARKECHKINFGLNPFENNAYGEIMIDGNEFIIDPPTHSNGDSNWYSYQETDCTVSVRSAE